MILKVAILFKLSISHVRNTAHTNYDMLTYESEKNLL